MANEIADRLDVSRPVVTETVKVLVQAGLLASAAVPKDRRAKRLSLTPAGKAALADLLPSYFATIATIAAFMARRAD